jgi:hypothetical protein
MFAPLNSAGDAPYLLGLQVDRLPANTGLRGKAWTSKPRVPADRHKGLPFIAGREISTRSFQGAIPSPDSLLLSDAPVSLPEPERRSPTRLVPVHGPNSRLFSGRGSFPLTQKMMDGKEARPSHESPLFTSPQAERGSLSRGAGLPRVGFVQDWPLNGER